MQVVVVKIKGSDNRMQTMSCRVRQDGVLIKGNSPLFVGGDFTEAGISVPKSSMSWEDYSAEEQALALTIDHERVAWSDDPDYTEINERAKRFLAGDPEDTRERQNAFLKEKGYRWEKRGVYHSNPGELVDAWFLLAADGEVVCGWKDSITEELTPTGPSLKSLLTQLGYYGQEAIDKAEAKTKEAAERREMREKVDAYFADDANRTGETFENAQSLFTVPPIEIEKHYPRRQFRIEKDCIWHESWNSSDGDDWSRNNSSYGIARQYNFDPEIADCLRKLAS